MPCWSDNRCSDCSITTFVHLSMLDKQLLTLTVSPEMAPNTRLDKVLLSAFRDYSRNYFQELIEKGNVLVNTKQTKKPSFPVRPGDIINVTLTSKICNTAAAHVDFEVVFEHTDFLVINKPAGLMVHPAPASPNDLSLVNGLLYRYPELTECGDQVRPGIVHRIDKNTSGLLIVARNPRAEKTFAQMFKDRTIQKEYIAVVQGHTPAHGIINSPIGRSFKERHKMATHGIAAREALTRYKTLAYVDDYSLVQVKIVTGRTHQIRVHFQSIGHSLLGDETYGAASKLLGRQALHAWNIKFEYEKNNYDFKVPLADDIQKSLIKIDDLFDFNLTIPASPIE